MNCPKNTQIIANRHMGTVVYNAVLGARLNEIIINAREKLPEKLFRQSANAGKIAFAASARLNDDILSFAEQISSADLSSEQKKEQAREHVQSLLSEAHAMSKAIAAKQPIPLSQFVITPPEIQATGARVLQLGFSIPFRQYWKNGLAWQTDLPSLLPGFSPDCAVKGAPFLKNPLNFLENFICSSLS